MKEQYFYHSFPRWNKKDRKETYRAALKILKQIFDSGLLLSTEVIHYPGADLTDIYQRKIISYPEFDIMQTRLCLTSIDTSELGRHMKEFGPITIEFSKDDALSMGAIPVIYLPPKEDVLGKSLKNLASEILMFLHITGVMLKDVNPQAPAWDPNNPIMAGRPAPLTLMALRDYMSPLFGFFYPTENKRYSSNYYEQREWRVVGPIAGKHNIDNAPLMVPSAVFEIPTDAEKEKIVSVNEKFWSGVLEYKAGPFKRIEKALYFRHIDGKDVQSLIKRVIVPWRVYFQAKKIVRESRFPRTSVELYFFSRLKDCFRLLRLS